jgi:hypothetical protein
VGEVLNRSATTISLVVFSEGIKCGRYHQPWNTFQEHRQRDLKDVNGKSADISGPNRAGKLPLSGHPGTVHAVSGKAYIMGRDSRR